MLANHASILTPSTFAAGPNETLWVFFSILICIPFSMTRFVPVVPGFMLIVDIKFT
jgi:hypothetical protein